ncbi:DUF4260 domain-containing protein [Chitinophaga sedimenti]|uniref:DUF4260 domain-containing protein n=1 Tax=Chitinophaga sedimenti TaxID=2033606 RepID=UPI0020049893|nr:DUF4260 domain-containing protein [Chitinophaga sedimenti]MCK7554103.1 DUF4260 domain-containing protein [Chitinophaga sedimenti]
MKYLLQAEAIVPFIIAVVLLHMLPIHFSWWMWIVLFLAPDISMFGYLLGNRVGGIIYNLFHHQLLAVAVWGFGLCLYQPAVQLAGLVLLGHSSLDRLMGYGLKLPEGFNFTHLGVIGKKG